MNDWEDYKVNLQAEIDSYDTKINDIIAQLNEILNAIEADYNNGLMQERQKESNDLKNYAQQKLQFLRPYDRRRTVMLKTLFITDWAEFEDGKEGARELNDGRVNLNNGSFSGDPDQVEWIIRKSEN